MKHLLATLCAFLVSSSAFAVNATFVDKEGRTNTFETYYSQKLANTYNLSSAGVAELGKGFYLIEKQKVSSPTSEQCFVNMLGDETYAFQNLLVDRIRGAEELAKNADKLKQYYNREFMISQNYAHFTRGTAMPVYTAHAGGFGYGTLTDGEKSFTHDSVYILGGSDGSAADYEFVYSSFKVPCTELNQPGLTLLVAKPTVFSFALLKYLLKKGISGAKPVESEMRKFSLTKIPFPRKFALYNDFSAKDFRQKLKDVLMPRNENYEEIVQTIISQNPGISYYTLETVPHGSIRHSLGKKYRTPLGTYLADIIIYECIEGAPCISSFEVYKKRVSSKKFVVEKDKLKLDETKNQYDLNDRLAYVLELHKNDFESIHKRVLEDNTKIKHSSRIDRDSGLKVYYYGVTSGFPLAHKYRLLLWVGKNGKIVKSLIGHIGILGM